MGDLRDEFGTTRARREGAAPDDLAPEVLGADDSGLSSLLSAWRVEDAPERLRSRVVGSYRREFGVAEEVEMERFVAGEGFGAGLAFAGAGRGEYRPTIIDEEGLLRRLLAEVLGVARDSRLTRAELRRDPFGFARRLIIAYAGMGRRFLAQENVSYGVMASLAVLLAVAGAVGAANFYGKSRGGLLASNVREDLDFRGMIDVPKEQPKPDEGSAGMAKGHGGGQKAKFEKPGGGGGGGRNELKPASAGKLPVASLDVPQVRAPDPHPPTVSNPNLPVPAIIKADPVLFPPDTRNLPYGDPKSKSTETSSGPGTGGGIGTGTGGGVGPGDGGGVGPGRDGNTGGGDFKVGGGGPGGPGGGDYDRVFRVNEVTKRAQIVSRPEPLYTEEARKNQITGTVRVRMILNANGTVSGISAASRLPDGLTEKAIEAARKIKFVPAEKDGRKVSQYISVDYNFNIY